MKTAKITYRKSLRAYGISKQAASAKNSYIARKHEMFGAKDSYMKYIIHKSFNPYFWLIERV